MATGRRQAGRVVVVGSGASGVHFALSLLHKGYQVLMLDVGHRPEPTVHHPGAGFERLKAELDDPVQHFLGREFEGLVRPGLDSEYYGLPPGKGYVLREPRGVTARAEGFAPLFSFARGGLAEAWTAGVYPFNDAELRDFPFGYAELAPHYAEVARRIGVSGEADDLARFYPVHDHLMKPLRLDRHSRRLLDDYGERRDGLNGTLRTYMGRSRIATLTAPRGDRRGCSYCGRCLWGCPARAIYTPAITLEECRTFSGFQYVPDVLVTHFAFDGRRRVTAVVAEDVSTGAAREFPVDALALAAGTLSTSAIFLESVYRGTGEMLTLGGLMDNRQILIPFVNLGMLGSPYEPESYQYHQVALGLEGDDPRDYVHAQITTLKTAQVHPIVQSLPFDLRTATGVFRALRSALGIVNVNLRDTRRPENVVTLEQRPGSSLRTLRIAYVESANEKTLRRRAVGRVRGALRRLGCVVPPGMTHVRPMGASVHYAGTIPMATSGAPCTATAECRSADFHNLFFVDGTTFPFLPAKNITFTLMANAARVAAEAF